jgi:hypothetical protein
MRRFLNVVTGIAITLVVCLLPATVTQVQAQPATQGTAPRGESQEAGDEGDPAQRTARGKAAVSVSDPVQATEHQGFDRKSVSVVAANREVRAILSNPFIPQTPTVRFLGSRAQTGLFGQILNISCEADNALLVDALTMNEKAEQQMGTWRVKADGSVVAEEVFGYAPNDRSWVRRIPRYRFRDGSPIKANLPAGEKTDRRIMDAIHDDIIYTSSKHSGEGHIYLGSIFSIWRQSSGGQVQRLVSWSPTNMNIEKYGYSYDMKGFYSGRTKGLAIDSKGQVYVAMEVDDAAYGANRTHRHTIYRVDEAKRKLVPIIDADLERSYTAGKQTNDPAFAARVSAPDKYYEDGPVNKAFVGKAAINKMCFDQKDILYVLDNFGQQGGQTIRKIDFVKNEMTTWVY